AALQSMEPAFSFIGRFVAANQMLVKQFWADMGQLGDKVVEFVRVTWPPFQSVLNTLESVFQRVFGTIANVIERVWRVVKPILDQFRSALGSLDPTGLLGKLGSFFSSSGGGGTPPVAGGDGATLPKLSDLRPSATLGASPGGALPKLSDLRPGPRPWLLNDPLAPGASATSPGAAPSGFNWDAVAQAESSGNWSDRDSGHNGHYGGLQFAPDTWAAYGGTQFAQNPADATPEQQKIIADRVAFYGWQGKPPQGLGAWEAITTGKVPGVTTSSQPPSMGMPSAAMPSVPGASATIPGIPGLNLSIPGKAPEEHLQPGAVQLNRIISQLFPDVSSIGGWRANDPFPDHPSGRALDIMVGANKALGDQINQFLQQNAAALGIQYTLWQQQEWDPGKGPSPMENRGSPTENHMDHVHAMIRQGALPNINGMVYPSAMMPTVASPGGISPDGTYPLGTQNSPFYVMPAQSSGAEQLGQDFVSGIAEVFGFDGSLFKNPLDSGLFKGFKGLMSFLTGGGKGGQGQGMPASYWQGGGAMPAMGGGDIFSGLGGMLTSIIPQPFGQIRPGGPAQAPDEFQPMLPGSGGNATLPGNFTPSGMKTAAGGNQIDNSINFYGPVGKPQDIHQTAMDLNVPRARQGVQSIPGMSMP
ncbi:transglycosylase family protein, partial [Mycobacterium sp. E1747]|uniref:transglycosylase family protein n=1 Tax=Mycobacterium sp. E1747 TaxID=1834128 RepID=UPI000AD27A3D